MDDLHTCHLEGRCSSTVVFDRGTFPLFRIIDSRTKDTPLEIEEIVVILISDFNVQGSLSRSYILQFSRWLIIARFNKISTICRELLMPAVFDSVTV